MNKNENKKDKRRWYQNSGGAILFLILFFPVGIYLMWRYTDWSNKVKWVVTSIFVLIFVISAFATDTDVDNQSNDNAQEMTIEESEESKEKEESEAEQENKKQNSSDESLEYKLAVINSGGYVSEDDVSINRFRYLLGSINKKTNNTKQEIADMTCGGWEMLEDNYGVEISLLEFMEGANDSIPSNIGKVDYGEILAGFVVLLGQ
jgi:hypothetical protein